MMKVGRSCDLNLCHLSLDTMGCAATEPEPLIRDLICTLQVSKRVERRDMLSPLCRSGEGDGSGPS